MSVASQHRFPARREDLGIVLVRWTLAALFLDQFFVNLHDHNYTQSGYIRLVTHYMRGAQSPAVWLSVERFVVHHAHVFAVAQAIGELSLGVALAVGLVRPVAGLATGGLLLALWVSELGLGWIWEFPPIIIGSFAVAVANAAWFLGANGWRDRLLGPRVGRPLASAVGALAAGLILAVFILAHHDPTIEAWRAVPLFTAALLLSALLDLHRAVPPA